MVRKSTQDNTLDKSTSNLNGKLDACFIKETLHGNKYKLIENMMKRSWVNTGLKADIDKTSK